LSLNVHFAKAQLLDMYSKMLAHQLQLLENRKNELESTDVQEKRKNMIIYHKE